jgi:hypothetical protein
LPSRGLLLILVAGLILAIGAVGAARRDTREATTTTTQPPSAAPVAPPDAGGAAAGVVSATLPADRVVRAKVGDQIELRVTSEAPDILTIPELAVRAPVGPGVTGPIRFSALSPGTFDARLDLAQSVIGRVSVAGGSSG